MVEVPRFDVRKVLGDDLNPAITVTISTAIPFEQLLKQFLQLVKSGQITPSEYLKRLDRMAEILDKYRGMDFRDEL